MDSSYQGKREGVSLFFDGNCSMMTFNKTGDILKHEKLEYTAIDGGDLLKLC